MTGDGTASATLEVVTPPARGEVRLADGLRYFPTPWAFFTDKFSVVAVANGMRSDVVEIAVSYVDQNANEIPDFVDADLGSAELLGGIENGTRDLTNRSYLIKSTWQIGATGDVSVRPGAAIYLSDAAEIVVAGTLRIEGQVGTPARLLPARINPIGWKRIAFVAGAKPSALDANDNYVSGSLIKGVEIAGFAEDATSSLTPLISSCDTVASTYLLENVFIHSPIGTSGIRLLGKCSGLSVSPRYVVKSSVLEVDDRDLGIAFESQVFDAVFTRFEAFDSTFRGHAATFAIYQPKRLDHCQIVATPARSHSMTGLEITYSSDDPVSVTNTIVNQGVTVNLGAAFLALPNPPVTEGNIFRLGSSTYLLTMMGGASGQTYQFGPNYFDYSGDINAVILDGKTDVTRPFADISKRLSLPPAAGPRVKDLDGDGLFDDVDPNPLMPSP